MSVRRSDVALSRRAFFSFWGEPTNVFDTVLSTVLMIHIKQYVLTYSISRCCILRSSECDYQWRDCMFSSSREKFNVQSPSNNLVFRLLSRTSDRILITLKWIFESDSGKILKIDIFIRIQIARVRASFWRDFDFGREVAGVSVEFRRNTYRLSQRNKVLILRRQNNIFLKYLYTNNNVNSILILEHYNIFFNIVITLWTNFLATVFRL